jgi:hypothetical protein
MADISSLISAYADLLPMQYRDKPKARATIEILCQKALADGLALDLANAFDIDTAVGAQLDIIGKYVGVSRYIQVPASFSYYGFRDYISGHTQNTNGMQTYTGSLNAGILYKSYASIGQSSTAISDEGMRFIIKLQIISNHSDASFYGIQHLLLQFFGDAITVVDNLDMTMTYSVLKTIPVSIATITPFLPKPMGVGINVVIFDPYTVGMLDSSGEGVMDSSTTGLTFST